MFFYYYDWSLFRFLAQSSFLIKKGKNINISPLAIYDVFKNVQGSSGAKFDTVKLGDRFKD